MKLSTRKELLKESELTLKSIKKSLNEATFDISKQEKVGSDIEIGVAKIMEKSVKSLRSIFGIGGAKSKLSGAVIPDGSFRELQGTWVIVDVEDVTVETYPETISVVENNVDIRVSIDVELVVKRRGGGGTKTITVPAYDLVEALKD